MRRPAKVVEPKPLPVEIRCMSCGLTIPIEELCAHRKECARRVLKATVGEQDGERE